MLVSSCFDSGEGEEAGGGLFLNHQEVADAFEIQLPTSRTYAQSENIDFVLVHPANVTVTGTPRLILDVGGSTLYANYASGSGTNILIFRYTVGAGENDSDGLDISVNSIDLNGGTLQYALKGVLYDANTGLQSTDTTGILVDTNAPAIFSVVGPVPGKYSLGDTIQFVVTFDEAVQISGTPQLDLDFNGTTIKAN